MQEIYIPSPAQKRCLVPSVATSITIGNFDGYHLGHQRLVKSSISLAKQINGHSLLLTFNPHPDDFFSHDQKHTPLLFTEALKKTASRQLGLEFYVEQTFDNDFAGLSPEEFFRYLQEILHCQALTVGENFRFGKNRLGDADLLRKLCDRDNIHLNIVAAETFGEGLGISSSLVRKTIADDGNVELASRLLGRPYLMIGSVVRGNQKGRLLGFPTLNLKPADQRQVVPARGVYSGYVWIEDGADASESKPLVFPDMASLSPAVINIGLRPTVSKQSDELALTIESHLFDKNLPQDSMYEKKMAVYFCHRLRDEKKFMSINDLSTSIANDIVTAKKLLKR